MTTRDATVNNQRVIWRPPLRCWHGQAVFTPLGNRNLFIVHLPHTLQQAGDSKVQIENFTANSDGAKPPSRLAKLSAEHHPPRPTEADDTPVQRQIAAAKDHHADQ